MEAMWREMQMQEQRKHRKEKRVQQMEKEGLMPQQVSW
jgi:hypothetical protein